ncbi:porin [Methylosinus sporium]|nr:porin [Methylosinus sporium]
MTRTGDVAVPRPMRREATNVMAAGLAFVSLFTGAARADTTDQLLDQLKAKGILTKGEYRKLKARHAAETAAPARAAVASHAAAQPLATPSDRFITRLDKGIGARVGAVDVRLSGQLAFFATEQFKQAGTAIVAGGLGGGSVYNNSSAIRSGLLPSALALSLSTEQEGYKVSFSLGLYAGGNNIRVGLLNGNSSGASVALGTPGVDLRQVFGEISSADYGALKVGRDLGLFAADAILNDFTLFGAGTIAANASPSNTSLGRIGFGYVYADWIPQLTYTTPDFHGVTVSVGVFSPYQQFDNAGSYVSASGVLPYSGVITGHDQPGFQARLKYVGELAPGTKLTLWTSGLTQRHRVESGDAVLLPRGAGVRSMAIDAGGRLDVGPVTLVGYGYKGVGLGTTGLYFDGVGYDGERRKSSGYYAQAGYTLFERLTFGGSYGVSYLEANLADYPGRLGDGALVASNASTIGFVKYRFTDWVTFQSEFVRSVSHNLLGQGVRTNALVAGTIFSF